MGSSWLSVATVPVSSSSPRLSFPPYFLLCFFSLPLNASLSASPLDNWSRQQQQLGALLCSLKTRRRLIHQKPLQHRGQSVSFPVQSGKSFRDTFIHIQGKIVQMHEKQCKIRCPPLHYCVTERIHNNLTDGRISSSFPAIWRFGWKTLIWRFRRENGDSAAPFHILFWTRSVSHVVK